jgi:nicotinamidase-related amidase
MAEKLPRAAGRTALLVIDMINDMAFEEGDDLVAAVDDIVDAVATLRDQAEKAGVPVIYVNDNFGQWHSDRQRIIEHVEGTAGQNALKRLRPRSGDYFIIKPQVSGFYATNLPVLLPRLGVSRLILAGVAADICVLFTAADAHMREYALWVPNDVVASDRPDGGRRFPRLRREPQHGRMAQLAAESVGGAALARAACLRRACGGGTGCRLADEAQPWLIDFPITTCSPNATRPAGTTRPAQ